MFSRIIELFTGKDDLERVASREDPLLLNDYLKRRPILVPQRPELFLDPETATPAELAELSRGGTKRLAGQSFEPWILEIEGQRRLPVFSSYRRIEVFAGRISQELNKVFGLGCLSILLEDVTKSVDIDFVDLNLYGPKSWEIGVR